MKQTNYEMHETRIISQIISAADHRRLYIALCCYRSWFGAAATITLLHSVMFTSSPFRILLIDLPKHYVCLKSDTHYPFERAV